MFQNGLSLLAGATLMDVSVIEKQVKTRQLLTERFSSVWSITYRLKPLGLTIDYTGNVSTDTADITTANILFKSVKIWKGIDMNK